MYSLSFINITMGCILLLFFYIFKFAMSARLNVYLFISGIVLNIFGIVLLIMSLIVSFPLISVVAIGTVICYLFYIDSKNS